jgi:hypothetical protein
VAPQLASMFGTPLAGMAVSAIANVLLPGKANPTEADVAQVVMGLAPADLVKLHEIEADVTKALSDAGVKLEAIDAGDRDSARQMQEKLNSWTVPVLSVLIVGVWGYVQYYVFHNVVPPAMEGLVGRMLGTLDSVLTCVVFFHFGSSASSRAKDATIKKVAESA